MEDILILTRRERKKLDCKYTILRAAQQLFEEKGVDNATINEISELADVSYTTFFNYFPSKESLLIAIYSGELEDLNEFIQIKLKNETSAIKKIEEVFYELMKDCFKYRRMSMRLRETIALKPGFETLRSSIHDIFKNFIEEGIKNGEIKPDIDGELCSLFIEGFNHSLLYNDRSMEEAKTGFEMFIDLIRL
ncbi:MAG: TetR/AcrR family transcriptional regulator [Firmicutes bacterium]|nr:TetR/AcrR family transcriptional regulator [Bacillota bacterium]